MFKKLILCASLSFAATAQADIVIGQSVPTSGIAADTGKSLALGASIYFNKINSAGGVNGEKINHIVRDDGYDPKRSIQNTKDLIDKENALVLVSYYGSATTGELLKSKTLENAGIPLIGVHSGAESIRTPGSLFLFHTRASYAQETDRLVQLLAGNLGVNKIAVVAQQDAFGEAGVAGLKASLLKHKLQLAGEAWYDRSKGDTTAAAKTLSKLNPEAVILVAVSKPAATFTKQFKEFGGTSQLYALSPVMFEEVARAVGKKMGHGLGISQVYPYPNNTRSRLIKEFQDDVYAELGDQASGAKDPLATLANYSSYAVLEGYVAAKIAVEAIQRAGKAPTRTSVYNALTKMNKFDMGGFSVDFNDKKRNGSNYGEITMMSPSGALTR